MRSMSEFTCNDFAARPESLVYSEASSYKFDGDDGGSLMRSASQPSLARSASEFTERRWALESNAAGDLMASSPEQTPVMSRRAKSSEMLLVSSSSTSAMAATTFVASSSSAAVAVADRRFHQQRWTVDNDTFK